MPGQTNATLTIETLATSDAGNYTAAVRFDVGEPIFDIAQVTVLAAPPGPAIIDQPVGGDREVGQSFEFDVRAWSAGADHVPVASLRHECPGASRTLVVADESADCGWG